MEREEADTVDEMVGLVGLDDIQGLVLVEHEVQEDMGKVEQAGELVEDDEMESLEVQEDHEDELVEMEMEMVEDDEMGKLVL